MKRILLSGGAGFIGSHLTEKMLAEGYHVTVLDNFITGQEENMDSFRGHPHFEFHSQDVSKDLSRFEKQDWYGVLHLASPASPVDYVEKSLETMHVNSIGTENMLKVAKAAQARFLFSSTSEVYGDPEVHPQKEEYWGNVSSTGTRSCYDESKRYAEALIYTYQRLYGLEVRVARIFNTYGPRNRINDGRVVPNFICQCIQNKPLTVFGTGQQTRSFCYVEDLVLGLLALLEGDYSQPVNLGNPIEMSILDFGHLIHRLENKEPQWIYEELVHVDDPKQRCPDITKAKTLLDWEPRISPEEGMKRTIAFYKSKLL